MSDDVTRAINSLVPISDFNKGKANKIFNDIKESGYKIVVKNNKPVCVLITPQRYEEMICIIEDQKSVHEGNINADEKTLEEKKKEFFADKSLLESKFMNRKGIL